MIEKIEFLKDKSIEIDLPEKGNVGILVSGGADSAILTFLLAKVIRDHNLETNVYPITAELLKRPFNLRHSFAVLSKITEITGYQFPLHLNFMIPNHTGDWDDQKKVELKSKYTTEFAERYHFECLYNALTSNPPEEDLPSMEASMRPGRDSKEWRDQQKNMPGQKVPLIDLDKRDIAALYAKFGLVQTLFPLTRSCEGEKQMTENFNKACIELLPADKICWWCRERDYAFKPYL